MSDLNTTNFELVETFPIAPSKLYEIWLSSDGHTNMTGGEAIIEASIQSDFSAWDGYITGKILELDKDNKILHAWRTSEFSDESQHSLVEVRLEATSAINETKLTLTHWDIPADQTSDYYKGWQEHYFEPMKIYFNSIKDL